MKYTYKGCTPAKQVTRRFVWWLHQQLLGSQFLKRPHVFLASRDAGDVGTLRTLKVDPDRIWAVESNPEECCPLYARKEREGFRVFREKIEVVLESHAEKSKIRSVYLDFCGTMDGKSRKATARVVATLPRGSVVSITHIKGREKSVIADRGAYLLKHLRQFTDHPVTLVQSISYMSEDLTGKGSPMMTWTFQLEEGIPKNIYFDLTQGISVGDMSLSETLCRKVWSFRHELARKRHLAAVQANITRRIK